MKKVLLGLSIVAMASSVLAAPAIVLVDQGGTDDLLTTDDAAAAFADMAQVPVPSSTDMVNGNAGFQIDSRPSHNNSGPLNLTAFTDGAVAVAYPGQLPDDYPGIDTPAVSIGYDLGGSTDIGSIVVYAYNWNSGTPDIRAIAPFAVFTTTDATVNAGSSWTEVVTYAAPTGIPPANLQFYTGNTIPGDWSPYVNGEDGSHASAIVAADDAGAALATGVTGVRVDIYCAGHGDQLRDAENSGNDVQAVTSPFLAEIDVLSLTDTQAFYTGASDVENWEMFD